MNQDAKERTLMEQEKFLDGTVSVREVLNFIESDRYLSLTEASRYLGFSKRGIRDRLDEIPHYLIGTKLYLFKKSELDAWLVQYRKGEWWELRELVDGAVEDVIGD